MKDRRRVEDLSLDELQRVLQQKKQAARDARLAKYRQTGRALPVVPVGTLPEAAGSATELSAPRSRSRTRRVLDAMLLVVEVAAVLGLIFVFYSGANMLNSLNQEAAEAMSQSVQALPTVAPTPVLTAVVLPGGHKPRSLQPDFEEIPANLRPLVQSMPAPIIPTQSPQQAARVIITKINVDAPVVQGDGWEQLKKGVGQHLNGALPGLPGNLVLSAHNDIYGEIFRNLDQLSPGDEVQVYTAGQVVTYIINGWRTVTPTEVSVLSPTEHSSLTLISCYPYLVNNLRIVVTADIKTD